jgi:hypothetical protein
MPTFSSLRSACRELWDDLAKQAALSIAVAITFQLAGFLVAKHLSELPKVELFKLLNLFGLLCDGVGVALLSNLLTRHVAALRFITGTFYTCALGFLVFFPFGLSSASLTLYLHGGMPGSSTVSILVLSAFVGISGFLMEHTFVAPRWKGRSARYKSALLGTYLLLLGFLMQFVAAYLDLRS